MRYCFCTVLLIGHDQILVLHNFYENFCSLSEMDFNVKKIVSDAGTLFSRAVQFTEEKLGTSERTELDTHFENLVQRCDKTKAWTEKLLRDIEAIVTPNPGNRVEDFLMEKMDRKRPTRLSSLDYLGIDMVEAGNDLGPSSSYGATLLKAGVCQQKLGALEREWASSATQNFIEPLRKFLDNDMKAVMRERKLLETKRLDLDACKNRLRKAKTPSAKQIAEDELVRAQADFDHQSEVTRLLLEGLGPAHNVHCRYLQELMAAQARYFLACNATLQQFQKELGFASVPGSLPTSPLSSIGFEGKRARVLCDYDSQDPGELSLIAGEVIDIISPNVDPDFVLAQRGHQKGRVPSSYLEYLDN